MHDALRQLEADGLVSIRHRLGACVRTMDLNEFEEMNELRLALECHAVGSAARRRTPAELEAIRAPMDALNAAIDAYIANFEGESLPRAVFREDIYFHIAIVNAAKNDLMKKEIFRLHLIHRVVSAPAVVARGGLHYSDRVEPVTKLRQISDEHRAIFEAISHRDAAAAKSAMERHLLNNIHASPFAMVKPEPAPGGKDMTKEEFDLST